MKLFVLTFLLLGLPTLYAHDHIEVGIDPLQRTHLDRRGKLSRFSYLCLDCRRDDFCPRPSFRFFLFLG